MKTVLITADATRVIAAQGRDAPSATNSHQAGLANGLPVRLLRDQS